MVHSYSSCRCGALVFVSSLIFLIGAWLLRQIGQSLLSTTSAPYKRASLGEKATFERCSTEEDPTRYEDEDATSKRRTTVGPSTRIVGHEEDEDVETLAE